MDGDRKESPRYTDRMAEVSSEDAAVLLTKPLAPASMSPVRASKAQMPSRTMAWSSVTSTLIFVISNVLTYWNLGPNHRSRSDLGLDAARAAKKAHPLSHAE